MEIKSIEPCMFEYVEAEEDSLWYLYRRYQSGEWEILMGQSWEPCYFSEQKLEELYQKFIQKSA